MLDRLDANLRAEQRSFAELDFLMFTQLLTPIQARVQCRKILSDEALAADCMVVC